MYTSSPYHIPNSQAPIPGKEVYWDYDTPQSRKYREALRKEFEESDSPVARKNATPKLRMVHKPRVESEADLERVRKGEQAMQDLLEFCREAEAEKQDEIDGNSKVKIESADHVLKAELKFDDLSMESKIKKEVGEMRTIKTSISLMEEDMFADDFHFGEINASAEESERDAKSLEGTEEENINHLNSAITGDDMDFDDDDDSFLVTATQMESEYAAKIAVEAKINGLREAEVTQAMHLKERERAVVQPAVNSIKDEINAFGNDQDDSFDMMMSQMVVPSVIDAPNSPVLRRKRKCMDLAAPSQPQIPPIIGNKSGKAEKSTELSAPLRNLGSGGSLRKFSSFDSQEQKKTFSRVKSDPYIVPGDNSSVSRHQAVLQPVSLMSNRPITRSVCSKEDIERKKREALARRQQSQSQVKKI